MPKSRDCGRPIAGRRGWRNRLDEAMTKIVSAQASWRSHANRISSTAGALRIRGCRTNVQYSVARWQYLDIDAATCRTPQVK